MVGKVMKISDSNLFVPARLGKLTVIHDGREFSVIDSKGLKSNIQRAFLDKELRGISNETLKKMLDAGYLNINKTGEDYAANFKGRLKGGGPFTGISAYVATNIVGGVMVLGGSVLVATGVGAPAGAALVVSGFATVTAAPVVLAVTLLSPTP